MNYKTILTMIRVQELRKGNLVLSKVNGISKVEQIGSSINPEYVAGRSLEGNYWENSYLPITLTEEWLDRLPEYLVSEDIPSWVKFVHQLQNWYWVENKFEKELDFKNPLTGEELTV